MNPMNLPVQAVSAELVAKLAVFAHFPKFAIGEESAESKRLWVAHLHSPIFLARMEIPKDKKGIVAHITKIQEFDIDRGASEDLISKAVRYFCKYIEEDEAGLGADHEAVLESEKPSEHYVVFDGPSHWQGIVRAQNPRLVSEAHGACIQPLESSDNILPFIKRAGEFYTDYVESCIKYKEEKYEL